MSGSIILLVGNDERQHQAVTSALAARGIAQPVQVTSGEAAVTWLGSHPCDVCLLNYHLPGINGLETLQRIRQRKPDLPIIMLSNARSEDVAVAAFRAGVVDYVPSQPGSVEAVAQQTVHVLNRRTQTESVHLPVARPDVPAQLLQPTYQNRLRVVGRQLDLYGYRGISLLEVGGGFLVRGVPPRSRTPEALEFPNRDFPQMVAAAIAARGEGERSNSTSSLLPTGYEDFLRALGYTLDQRAAEAITVTELEQFIAVGGVWKTEGFGHTTVDPFQQLLRKDDILHLLDEACQRRATPVQRTTGLSRLLRR